MSIKNFLKKVDLFAELSDKDLQEICEAVSEMVLPAGELLFAEGDRGDKAYIIKDGQLEITKQTSGREVLLAVREEGIVIGEMALLEEAPRMASVRARGLTTLIIIRKDTLDNLLDTSSSAARAMLQTVMERWRSTQSQLRQSEQMAQLGTLTAGVAHGLNNPSITRTASSVSPGAVVPFDEKLANGQRVSERQA
jgi:CRP-like cAMP-binding protein